MKNLAGLKHPKAKAIESKQEQEQRAIEEAVPYFPKYFFGLLDSCEMIEKEAKS